TALEKLLLSAILALLLSSCSVNGNNYSENSPKFVFTEFFDGSLCAWGTVKNDNSELLRKFIAKIDAYQRNGVTYLDEVFMFNDGEKQLRRWEFTLEDGLFSGVANDVVGSSQGKVYGDSLHLEYVMAIANDDTEWHINMDDWLHLIDENTLMGTTQMSKFGFNLGRVDIVIRRQKASLNECENFDRVYVRTTMHSATENSSN
ncbi:MAG: DUF3833 domain-containing protein, partial [Kangiellaceae bacterium]|nr:DUF3833 domain-containing protein [Kangiellaceae bacterium]